jgi:hypothetical protein
MGQNAYVRIEHRLTPEGNLMKETHYCLEGQNSGGRCVKTYKEDHFFSCVQNFLTR